MSRLVVVFVVISGSLCLAADTSTGALNSVTTTATQGLTKNLTKDGLAKRGVKDEDLSAKAYDPPPEYYRGPSTSDTSGYPSRPVAFPDGKYGYKGGSWSNNDPSLQQQQQQERKGLNDRVSVGHYSSGYGGGNHGSGTAAAAHPYGPPQAVEYEYYVPSGHGHGYSEGGGGGGGEGIPIELYNRGYGSYGGGHSGYGGGGGHGGEYSTYTVTTGHDGGGGGHHGKHGYDKALLAKSFLIPLASAAVLGIAAALASNPLLLQLGTVSSIGKRKRRGLAMTQGDEEHEEEPQVVHSMAYRRQRWN